MLLKACLNGPRRPAEHPALPITAAAIAAEAAAAVGAGAGAVHVHPRDRSGTDTIEPRLVAEVVTAVRAAVPGTPVGMTTGAWTVPDPDRRVAAVRAWTVLPDFASVNWHEDGADQVARVLLDRGIAVEAGLWHEQAIHAWIASPSRDRCLRVLLEVDDPIGDGIAQADALVGALVAGSRVAGFGSGRGTVPILLHGAGAAAWPVLEHSIRQGFDIRIGLEDVLTLPDGSPAAGNADLVRAARALLPP